MPLPDLLNVPQNPQDWQIWSFAHRDQHRLIRNAIQATYNINLTEYQLDPINLGQFQFFLDQNQNAHNDFNGVLNLQSSDLLLTDINDKAQLQAWIYLHRREHENAANALKIS